VDTFVSVQGGQMTATFRMGGREVSPFWVAPWWKEPFREADDWIVRVLRGDFFCFPFGGNASPFGGRKYALHGKTANECWDLVSRESAKGRDALTLRMDLEPDAGEVVKTISLEAGSPVLYQSHLVRGFTGKMSVGHHPTLWCGDEPGAALVDMSEPLAGFTLPAPVEVPENQGYSLLKANTEITDRSRTPTVYGGLADLGRYPLRRGHEDGALFVCDPAKPFCFTSLSFPKQGHLYFQLKNPRHLCQTVLWMCDGGRYAPPFSGRATGVLGAEEITSWFFAGVKESVEPNSLQQKGYRTYLDFSAAKPTEIKLIMGMAAIPGSFTGVKDIVRKDGSTITVLGRGGEKVDVACRADFLADR
jgi:hypothetical protein